MTPSTKNPRLVWRLWMALPIIGISQSAMAQINVQNPATAPTVKQLDERIQKAFEDSYARNSGSYADLWTRQLSRSGITDVAIQTAIVQRLEMQRRALGPLRDEARVLSKALSTEGTTDDEISALLANLRSSLRQERDRRAGAISGLDADVDYFHNPRVATALVLYGTIGEEAAVLDSVPQSLGRLNVKSIAEGLTKLGVNDEGTRATVLKFMSEQERQLTPLLAQAQRLHNLQTSGVVLDTDQKRQDALDEFRAAIAKHKPMRARALMKLDAKIGYTRSPRLEAALFLLGITSDDSSLLTGFDSAGVSGYMRLSDILATSSTQ